MMATISRRTRPSGLVLIEPSVGNATMTIGAAMRLPVLAKPKDQVKSSGDLNKLKPNQTL
jgi:hypothetical protein